MPSLYAENAEAFIKEVCRLDPPVTSATSVLKEPLSFTYPTGVFGVGKPFERTFKEGTLCQYTISIANRDPKVFKDPTLFNPKRANLEKSLSWNGAWTAGTHWSASAKADESKFPRICPGRYLSVSIVKAIVDGCLEGSKTGSV